MVCSVTDEQQVEPYLRRWQLRRDGPPRGGVMAMVYPVRRVDGTPAALKVQPVDEETAGEPAALRVWDGRGAVRLLEHDPDDGAMLLERLDAERPLAGVPDVHGALAVLSELLARLTSVAAPPHLRRLQDVAERMLARAPATVPRLAEPGDQWLVRRCAAAVADLLPVRADRLLHWDLHYDNVLAGEREPWLAIDPKPLAGEPGFELFPALRNRWGEAVASGDVTGAVRRRFDLMTEVLGLDRQRAAAWTLGRVLQDVLWEVERGAHVVGPVHRAIAHALLTWTR
jgi:streptomycin 6-kinase